MSAKRSKNKNKNKKTQGQKGGGDLPPLETITYIHENASSCICTYMVEGNLWNFWRDLLPSRMPIKEGRHSTPRKAWVPKPRLGFKF